MEKKYEIKEVVEFKGKYQSERYEIKNVELIFNTKGYGNYLFIGNSHEICQDGEIVEWMRINVSMPEQTKFLNNSDYVTKELINYDKIYKDFYQIGVDVCDYDQGSDDGMNSPEQDLLMFYLNQFDITESTVILNGIESKFKVEPKTYNEDTDNEWTDDFIVFNDDELQNSIYDGTFTIG